MLKNNLMNQSKRNQVQNIWEELHHLMSWENSESKSRWWAN